jgi:predicted dehydrogenase
MDVALIGCGRWGANILRDLRSLGARVHIVDTAPKAGEEVHPTTGTLPGVDAYIIATPSSSHAEIIESLLGTGLPIFVEKPMTTSVEKAQHLAAQAPGRLFVMDKWRYHNGIETLHREIDAGTIGEVAAIRLVRWSQVHAYDDVGPLWILAPHDLSIILHLFGAIPPVKNVEVVMPERPDLGLVATLEGAHAPKAIIDVGTLAGSAERRITIMGSEGLLELHGADATHLTYRGADLGQSSPESREIAYAPNKPLHDELNAFLHFLRGGPPPMSSAADGLLIVERVAEIESMASAIL